MRHRDPSWRVSALPRQPLALLRRGGGQRLAQETATLSLDRADPYRRLEHPQGPRRRAGREVRPRLIEGGPDEHPRELATAARGLERVPAVDRLLQIGDVEPARDGLEGGRLACGSLALERFLEIESLALIALRQPMGLGLVPNDCRSEERRVGKVCRYQ